MVGMSRSRSHAVSSSTWSMTEGRISRAPARDATMVATMRRPKTAVGLKWEKISTEKPRLMASVVKMIGLPTP